MNNRDDKEMIISFTSFTKYFERCIINPGFRLMHNEAFTALKMKMIPMNIKYQLFPTRNHRAKKWRGAIKTFKNHFIAVPCSVYKYFHLRLWDRLLHQATINLKHFMQSRTLPSISYYTHIFGEFDFNRTPLAPPGTRSVIHNRPNDRASWAPYGEYGCYIGPEMEHPRCHEAYIPKTRAERISYTIEPPPKKINMPHMSSVDATYHDAQDCI